MVDAQWFIEQYDAFLSEQGSEGAELEKSRDAVAHQYADAVDADPDERLSPNLVEEGRDAFDKYVGPTRSRRRLRIRDDAGYLLDALNDATILGADDPALAQAYPLGDGRDKTLFYWAVEDWQSAVTERYRNAAAVTAAAKAFDDDARKFIEALRRTGVRFTGDLYAAES